MAISLRINTLKTSPTDVVEQLQQDFPAGQFQLQPWAEEALLVVGVDRDEILQHALIQNGQVFPQSFSSMACAAILDPQKHSQILDLCAAPGGKTTHLAQMMSNSGQIIANDLSKVRSFKIKAIAKNLGVTNIKTLTSRGERLWQKYPNYFDKALVDAPCSMNQDKPAKRLKYLAHQQFHLLRSAISATKIGGEIVYATCTATEIENQKVVQKTLDRDPRVSLIPIDLAELPKEFLKDGFFIADDSIPGFSSFFAAKFVKNHDTLSV